MHTCSYTKKRAFNGKDETLKFPKIYVTLFTLNAYDMYAYIYIDSIINEKLLNRAIYFYDQDLSV